ncbi:NAD-dependent epimerase/dehydratase family protein [Amycolatopsis sp. NEAU-NG30]|uniref:NAD-dependent epimerase/dehydratase family protein n=1 Tax=Amycolatopsis melonis TaxID=3156488 RepID=A0ABV0LE99_9PSEU
MRVLVIGATGVLGRPTTARLRAAGHEVTAPAHVDLFSESSLVRALHGHDAVVNLATRIPGPRAMLRRSGWAANDRVRIEGSATLAAAVRQVEEVRTVVQEGISFVYADGGSRELTEEAPLNPRGVTASSVTAHENVAALTDRTVIRLRIGLLVGTDVMTTTMLAAARRGAPLIMGSRTDWTTAIHPPDAASAIAAAVEAPAGVYNVGAPPVLKGELGAALAAAAGVHRARAVPKWLVSWLPMAEPTGRSQRVVSRKLMEATGWFCERPVPGPEWFVD